ncbi:FKBP-type peptidyl-prolyl cis-trans isomerase [Novosphingobium sp. Chol11]|uniref:FKBP-type peptidyl-prolyl cis-trans isomerase n=1 Tax=Novosphingobium sp. Chol11 TaxID=1385763 RepID=UPI0025EEAD49|nr:FKBP-type peptidyl-prolyl cis-trans isomerase [Novosphingobium sp. Chol11]
MIDHSLLNRRIGYSLALAAMIAPTFGTAAPAPAVAVPASAAAAGEVIDVPLQPVVAADLRTCTAKTASGLGTKALRTADGARPAKDDFVLVKYIGYLASTGKVFDQNAGTAFRLSGVIAGFSEGILQMARGSISRLCIPAAIGYGEKSSGLIPANSDLVFQVELLDFKTQAEVEKINADAAREAEAQAAPAADVAPQEPAEKPAQKPAGQTKPPR